MGFVWCSIHGQLYGKNTPPDLDTPHAIAHDSELLSLLKSGSGQQQDHQHAVEFLIHLAVCNTVVPATTATGQLIYQVRLQASATMAMAASTVVFCELACIVLLMMLLAACSIAQ